MHMHMNDHMSANLPLPSYRNPEGESEPNDI